MQDASGVAAIREAKGPAPFILPLLVYADCIIIVGGDERRRSHVKIVVCMEPDKPELALCDMPAEEFVLDPKACYYFREQLLCGHRYPLPTG